MISMIQQIYVTNLFIRAADMYFMANHIMNHLQKWPFCMLLYESIIFLFTNGTIVHFRAALLQLFMQFNIVL